MRLENIAEWINFKSSTP